MCFCCYVNVDLFMHHFLRFFCVCVYGITIVSNYFFNNSECNVKKIFQKIINTTATRNNNDNSNVNIINIYMYILSAFCTVILLLVMVFFWVSFIFFYSFVFGSLCFLFSCLFWISIIKRVVWAMPISICVGVGALIRMKNITKRCK